MNQSSEMSVGEVEVFTDPETHWIFTKEVQNYLIEHFGAKFPILKEKLLELESEPDVVILRRIAENAFSSELVNSANSRINLLFSTIGQPPETIRKLQKKFNRLVKGRLFIDLTNDEAMKIEAEVKFLSSAPSYTSEEYIST